MIFLTIPRFTNLTLAVCLHDDHTDETPFVDRLYARRGRVTCPSHPPVGPSTLLFVNFSCAPPPPPPIPYLTHLLISGTFCTEVLGRLQAGWLAGWQAGKRAERLSVFANSTCLLLCYVPTSRPEIATLCSTSKDTSHACVFSNTVLPGF
jgi:hypothetical protein